MGKRGMGQGGQEGQAAASDKAGARRGDGERWSLGVFRWMAAG